MLELPNDEKKECLLDTDPNQDEYYITHPNTEENGQKIAVNGRKKLIRRNSVSNLFIRPIQHGSLKQSVFCMICVTLGTGMLPLPYFFKTNGIILTLIFFLACGFPTYITLKLLVDMAYMNNAFDWADLVTKYYGFKMEVYAIIVLLINSFGFIITWDVYIYQFTRDLLTYFAPNYVKDKFIIYITLAILFFIQIPLAAKANGTEFDLISTFGIIQIFIVILALILEFPAYAYKNFNIEIMKTWKTYWNVNTKMIEMPFVFITSFGNHSTILSVIQEVKNKNFKRVNEVSKKTFYGELIIYLIVFFISFFSTYDQTNEIFFIRQHVSLLMVVGEIGMTLLMICNICLYYYTTMPTLELIFNDKNKFSKKQQFMASFTVLTVLMYASFFVDNSISILTFLGIVAQISLIFIIPIIIYMKWKETELTIYQKARYIFYIILSAITAIGGLSLLLINQFVKIF